MALGGGGSRRRESGGSGASMSSQISSDPGTYNGITIRGFAGDTESLFQFVEALKANGKFIRVFFEDRFVDPVAVASMDNATGGSGPSTPAAGSGSQGNSDDDRGRRRGNRMTGAPASVGTVPGGAYQAQWNQAGTVLTFRIDVQISGPPADQAPPPPTSTAPAFGRPRPPGAFGAPQGAPGAPQGEAGPPPPPGQSPRGQAAPGGEAAPAPANARGATDDLLGT